MVSRTCKAVRTGGERCRAAPLQDGDFCLWHDPEHADVVAEGRRVGGSRRRKEVTIAAAYDFDGLDTVEAIRRLLQIASIDTLALDNSVNRNRTLAYLAQSAMKLLSGGEHEELLRPSPMCSGRRSNGQRIVDEHR